MKTLIPVTVVLLTALLIGTLAAKKGELELKDGRKLVGEIAETPDGYSITQPGGSATTFRKDEVKRVSYTDALEKAYDEKKAKIDPKDADALYALAQWAMNNKLNEQMGDAATAVLAINPNHAGAKILLRRYNEWKKNPVTVTPPVNPPVNPVNPPVTTASDTSKLTMKDVMIIRLIEMPLGANLGIAFVPPKAVDKYWARLQADKPEKFGGKPERDRFYGRPTHEQVGVIMDNISKDDYWTLAGDVTVSKDPPAMVLWKQRINPWMVNTCGSTSCHGGNAKAPWHVITNFGQDIQAIYTNFYVVSEYTTAKGVRLLDRDQADDSLLLRYALPADQAGGMTHPKVNGEAVAIKVPLRNPDDAMYRLIKGLLTEKGGLRSGLERLSYHINFAGVTPSTPKKPAGAGPGPAGVGGAALPPGPMRFDPATGAPIGPPPPVGPK